jgi:hypothetical protein
MFTTSTVNIPAGSMASELKALGSAGGVENQQSQLWKEFQEFQKFRQQQLATTTITPPPPSDPNVNSRIKIKATGEK